MGAKNRGWRQACGSNPTLHLVVLDRNAGSWGSRWRRGAGDRACGRGRPVRSASPLMAYPDRHGLPLPTGWLRRRGRPLDQGHGARVHRVLAQAPRLPGGGVAPPDDPGVRPLRRGGIPVFTGTRFAPPSGLSTPVKAVPPSRLYPPSGLPLRSAGRRSPRQPAPPSRDPRSRQDSARGRPGASRPSGKRPGSPVPLCPCGSTARARDPRRARGHDRGLDGGARARRPP